MAETAIFTQFITSNALTESLFIKLSTDTDISLSAVRSIRMEIAERLSSASPIVTYEFTDANGDFVNHIKPNPATKYYLDIGRTLEDAIRIELRCSKILLVNKKAGSTEQVAFKMFFVHHGWSALMNQRKSRGWKEMKVSEIVEEIAKECEYKEVEVGETITEVETFIQPYWTNLQTIQHLRMKAESENGGFTEFGCTIDGKFFFKSTGDLIEEQKAKAVSKEIPIFKLEGQILDPFEREKAYEENQGVPTYMAHITGAESYVEAVIGGGGGVVAMFYDSEADEFKKEPMKLSELEAPQLTDWSSLQEDDEVTELPILGGRDSDVTVYARNLVSDINNSVNTLEIVTEGAHQLHIGQMVEVIIPVPISIGSNVPQNIMYSGFYLVSAVRHVVNFQSSTITSNISLMRDGYDGKDLKGYVKTAKGKFI